MAERQGPQRTGGLGTDHFRRSEEGSKSSLSGALPRLGSGPLPATGMGTPSGWAPGSGPLGSGPLKAGPPPTPSIEALRAQLQEHAELAPAFEPRIRFLDYVMGLLKRSEAARKMSLAKQRPDLAQLAEGLLASVARDPKLLERMKVATERVAHAAQWAREGQQRVAQWEELPPELAGGALAGFDLMAFKRSVFLMSTLDAHFAGHPILTQIFPPVVRQGSLDPVAQIQKDMAERKAGRNKVAQPQAEVRSASLPLRQPTKSSPLAPRGDPAPAQRLAKPPTEAESGHWLGRATRRLEGWLAEASDALSST